MSLPWAPAGSRRGGDVKSAAPGHPEAACAIVRRGVLYGRPASKVACTAVSRPSRGLLTGRGQKIQRKQGCLSDWGTAVSGATDAARGAAALILTAPGLSVINDAIDEARRIFGRITTYTIYRIALTMDIMFVVVLSTIFLDFAPLTAMMIVAMSLLDDVPIMTIAYDHTPVSAKPIRWHMPQLLSVATVLGVFSIVETFGLLLIGIRVLSHPHLQDYFGLASEDQLQTVMFLQLVAGGHLLLFITRSERWFFLPPFPAMPLFSPIVLTQILSRPLFRLCW